MQSKDVGTPIATMVLLVVSIGLAIAVIPAPTGNINNVPARPTPDQPTAMAVAPAAFFTPPLIKNGPSCRDAVIAELAAARQTIRMQAYGFSCEQVATALCLAKDRGVDVIVIVDKSNLTSSYSMAGHCAAAGVKVFVDSKHAIAHNKIVIIDAYVVITGSYNFTESAAARNAENVCILHNKSLAKAYLDNFKHHHGHSVAFSK